jgi:hypothetical protein
MQLKATNCPLRAFALIAAGALIIAGHAMSVDIGDSGARYVRDLVANRPVHVAGGLITAVAALLLSVGLVATPTLCSGTSRRIARIAAIAASVGAAGMAMGLAMVAMVMGTLAGKDPALAVRAYDILDHATLASLPFLLAYLFTIGVLVLAVVLVRSGSRPRLAGLLLLIGTIVDFVSPSGGLLTAALHVPQAAGVVLLGIDLLLADASARPNAHPVEVPAQVVVA